MNSVKISILVAALLGVGVYAAFLQFVRLPAERTARSATETIPARNRQVVSASATQEADRQSGDRRRSMDPAAIERSKAKWHDHIESVEAGFRAEPIDPQWAATTKTKLEEFFSGNTVFRSTSRSIECRTRTCRVEIAADDSKGDVRNEIHNLGILLSDIVNSMQSERIQGKDGRVINVIYMSRGNS